MENYGLPLEGDKLSHPVIAVIRCHTGYCGQNICYEYFIPAGENIDEFAHQEARDNAASYGEEGYYYCNSCGKEDDNHYCDYCETDCEWVENENIEGNAYKYQPGKSGYYVNGGDPIDRVIKWCIEEGAVTLDGNKVIVNKALIGQLLHIPDQATTMEFEKDLLNHFTPIVTLVEYV